MRLDPTHLLTFSRVAEEGSLSRVAGRMHLTQPAVSNQMSRLSAVVGEPLFTRHRLGVYLTPAGEELLPHARAIVRALEGAEAATRGLQGLETGKVRVAASTTIASYMLPSVFVRFRREHPGLEVEQYVGNTREVVERISTGAAELALVEGPVDGLLPGVERHVVRRDEIVLVTLPDHPLSGESRRPDELEGIAVVWREKGSGTREVAEQALAGVSLSPVLELVGSEAVKEAVAEGMGAAFLSRLVVEREARGGSLAATRVDAPGLVRPLTLLRGPLEQVSRAGKAFIETLSVTDMQKA